MTQAEEFWNFDRTERTANAFIALHRVGDALDALAEAAQFGAETARICAATIDRHGPAPTDRMIDSTRDALAEAQKMLLAPALREARAAASALRAEQAQSQKGRAA